MLANMVMGKTEEIVVSEEPVLLWENPKPTSGFVGQTVEVDGVGYSGYIVTGRASIQSETALYSYAPVGGYSTLANGNINGPSAYRNIFNITNNSIQFDNANTSYGSEQNSNSVPLAIYGVKFVL